MRTWAFGAVFMGAVIAYALSGGVITTYLNTHALALVCLGSLAVSLLTIPAHDLRDGFGLLRGSVLGIDESNAVRAAVIALARKRAGATGSEHPLLAYAVDLWSQGLDSESFQTLMRQRSEERRQKAERFFVALRNLAKYPPALGMMGTVIGLVNLFSGLTSAQKDQLGPNLALAMTATFYGLLLSNVLILPLADRLQAFAMARVQNDDRLIQALLMIDENQPASLVEDRWDGGHAA